jgi:hypothetical protein
VSSSDQVTIQHPSAPGESFVVSRRSFASRAKRGWIEIPQGAPLRATSSTADVADESTSAVDAIPTSQED